jgi:hypothetical protein
VVFEVDYEYAERANHQAVEFARVKSEMDLIDVSRDKPIRRKDLRQALLGFALRVSGIAIDFNQPAHTSQRSKLPIRKSPAEAEP